MERAFKTCVKRNEEKVFKDKESNGTVSHCKIIPTTLIIAAAILRKIPDETRSGQSSLSPVAVFWVVTPCSDVIRYERFGGPCCLHLQGEVWPHLSNSLRFSDFGLVARRP
jgi:hypothetical protein